MQVLNLLKRILNICGKYPTRILSNMVPNWRYPMCLIPKSHYNLHGTGINDNHFLGIWVDPSIRLKDEDGKLNLSAINIKRIPGFSTNKLPPTNKWYLNIQFKKEFSNPYLNEWNKDEDGVYPLRDHYD